MPNDEPGDVSSFRLHELERNEELVFHFYQFIREKCFEHQNKFDRTLIFLSSGAIVLTYTFFETANTRPLWYSLFAAMMLWAATFTVSLVEYMLNIKRATLFLDQFGRLCILALRQHTSENAIIVLERILKTNGAIKKDKKLTTALSSFLVEVKKENKPYRELLKDSAKIPFVYNEPNTKVNFILLCLLIGGCIAFGLFTYLKRNIVPTVVPNAELTMQISKDAP